MKICFLTSSYPRFEGDIAGTFIKSLATHLVHLGHDVHVLRPYDGPTQPTPRAAEIDGIHEEYFHYAPFQSLRILGYGKSLAGDRHLKHLSYAMIGPYSLSAYWRLRTLSAKYRYDILHAHWVLPNGPVAIAAARALRQPVVISLHGSDVYVAEANPLFRATAGWSLRHASRVTACSANLRHRAIALGAAPDRTALIPYGVSLEMFHRHEKIGRGLRSQLAIGESDPVILAIGRFVFKKGFEFLIDAMPLVLAQYPSAKLILGGDGYIADELRARAAARQAGHAIRMPGQIPWDQVPTLLATADVFVVPSVVDDTGNVDGLPNVLLEAMAAGKAIVASRVGGIPEVVIDGETGILVREKSPEDLASGILRLLAAPDDRQVLGARARKFATEHLSWRSVAEAIAHLYLDATTHRFQARPPTGQEAS